MTSYDARAQAVAALLAALAGYVDASGFLATGGFFVSFMSGNTTRLGIGTAIGTEAGVIAASLIFAFLAGVIAGALAAHVGRDRRRATVLGLVALLLAGGATLSAAGVPSAAIAAMAVAMGAINNAFERNGEVTIGVSYMTGSLVKLGQRIAAAILGTDRFGWVSYFVLWFSFVVGVVGGALAYPHVGLAGLWGAALAAGMVALSALQRR